VDQYFKDKESQLPSAFSCAEVNQSRESLPKKVQLFYIWTILNPASGSSSASKNSAALVHISPKILIKCVKYIVQHSLILAYYLILLLKLWRETFWMDWSEYLCQNMLTIVQHGFAVARVVDISFIHSTKGTLQICLKEWISKLIFKNFVWRIYVLTKTISISKYLLGFFFTILFYGPTMGPHYRYSDKKMLRILTYFCRIRIRPARSLLIRLRIFFSLLKFFVTGNYS